MKNFKEISKSQIFTREQLKAIRGGDGYDDYYGSGSGSGGQKAMCCSLTRDLCGHCGYDVHACNDGYGVLTSC